MWFQIVYILLKCWLILCTQNLLPKNNKGVAKTKLVNLIWKTSNKKKALQSSDIQKFSSRTFWISAFKICHTFVLQTLLKRSRSLREFNLKRSQKRGYNKQQRVLLQDLQTFMLSSPLIFKNTGIWILLSFAFCTSTHELLKVEKR